MAFDTEAERSAVEASLDGLDIPADMLLFRQVGPVQDMLELDDRVRPVAGGLKGQRENHTAFFSKVTHRSATTAPSGT